MSAINAISSPVNYNAATNPAGNQLLGSGYSVNPGIQALQPFSNQQLQDQVSNEYANAFQQASTPYLMNQDYNPGTGTTVSAANMQLVAPQQAQILAGANAQAANQVTSDAMANAQSLLQGQQTMGNTSLGLGSLGLAEQNSLFGQGLNNLNFGNSLLGNMSSGSGYLGSLLGGMN